MIVHIKKIIPSARKRGYAVGAFNTSNLEMTLAIVRAAAVKKTPVIIQTSEATIKYAGLKTIVAIIKSIAETDGKNIPIAIHLDHGKNFNIIKECISAGYSSVHCDGSDLPFAKNISFTRRAVEYAHKHGVWAQGELGSMFGKEGMSSGLIKDSNSYMTDPNQVREFINKTGVDTLAVSIGTIHGSFKGKEKIDLERLVQINKIAKIPLVLHGASGNNPEKIKQAIKSGISIVNIDTDLRIAFTKALKSAMSVKSDFYDPRKILSQSMVAVQDEVIKKIGILGA